MMRWRKDREARDREEEEYIRARYPRSCRSPLLCPLCNQQHQFAACPFWYYEEPECPAPEWEEPERPAPEWEEPERPVPKWEEPERPAPEWEEPERPAPEWEEPERPKPKRGESVRPEPKRGESVRPEPKRGESVRPEPKRGESVRPEPKRGKSVTREPEGVELPSRELEGVELLSREPEREKAEAPQQPLHMLLRGTQGRRIRLQRQEVTARLQRPLEWPQPPPPLPECLEPLQLEELELPLPEWLPSPPVVPEGPSAVSEGLPTVPEGPASLAVREEFLFLPHPPERDEPPFSPPPAEGDKLLFLPPPAGGRRRGPGWEESLGEF
ncbi:UNVERIFIED_CONTAM: hypothetical protein FKN15_060580 [Acipenser sinensis]